MEEHSLLFGVISLLFVLSFILFASLCVKLEKKKQSNTTEKDVHSKPNSAEKQKKLLQTVSAMESAVQSNPALHRHLSTSNSHYADKRYRPIPDYESSPCTRSISSTSPRSTNSSERSLSHDLNRYRIGSESQKVRRDNTYVTTSHQRQRSLEAPRSIESKQPRYAPVPYDKKPVHLLHEQLKRTEQTISLSRDNSVRTSTGSTGSSSQKRNPYTPRSTTSNSPSVITGTLPIESATPKNSTSDSQSESSRYKLAPPSKPLVPKYSDSKLKGTPVRNARVEIDPPTDFMDDSLSPSRDSSQATDITIQLPSHIKPSLPKVVYHEDLNNILSSQYPNSRAVKRQLSHEDSNFYPPFYPPYYRPSIDSTCQLYSTQSNKNLPLRMRFPKLSTAGTDFADDETEGTSVCQSIYSSYTSLYQTDTEEFMIGEPQILTLSRELESPFFPDVSRNDQMSPLVAQYARQYTEDLLRSGRCPTNMSEYSDSDISFVWHGDDLGKHEYTPHDAPEHRNLLLPRHPNRKQGYTDYSGGISMFSFIKKDSIPEEIQSVPIQQGNDLNKVMTSPSRFVGYPKFSKSSSHNISEDNRYSILNPTHNDKDKIITSSRNVSKSNENIKLSSRRSLGHINSNSHPNLRGSKQPQTHYYDYAKLDHISLDQPPPLFPKVGAANNRNNSNNDLDNISGGSLTHL